MSSAERRAAAEHAWRAPSDPAAVPDATAAPPVTGPADAPAEGVEPELGADGPVADGPVAGEPVADEALLAGRTQEYRDRWHSVQLAFVDEPRRAVEEADHLVDDVIASIVDTLAGQRARLEAGWQQGTEATTEELRLALRRYRAFLNRLLAAG